MVLMMCADEWMVRPSHARVIGAGEEEKRIIMVTAHLEDLKQRLLAYIPHVADWRLRKNGLTCNGRWMAQRKQALQNFFACMLSKLRKKSKVILCIDKIHPLPVIQ